MLEAGRAKPLILNCYEKLGFKKASFGGSGQDGGIGRNASLPHTTKRRITTNQKTINNQKCQKMKLHETLRSKELKKYSPRKVGGTERGSQVERTHCKVADHVGKTGLAEWETKHSNLAVNYCGGCHGRINSQSHIGVHWKVG